MRSARALGQVKYVAAAVGRPELQLLFGARGRLLDRQLLFFTGSSYAAPALRYALENDIALFVYGLDGSMEARNAPARRITDRARAAETARAAEARRLTAAGPTALPTPAPLPDSPPRPPRAAAPGAPTARTRIRRPPPGRSGVPEPSGCSSASSWPSSH